jgi:mannose-6-phosphate isomerase-like protein (cupin superfamily)
MKKVNVRKKLEQIDSYWDPKVVGQLNGQEVKLVKFCGEFIWHKHETADELFYVISGSFVMQFRDGNETLQPGEFIIVPSGVEHCPQADHEVHLMLFEPAGTLNTGDVLDARTVKQPDHL